MRTKTLYKADGDRLKIDRFPCFHITGSIAGMKRMFYGKDALKPSYRSRYFVSNYQYIGYLRGDDMVVLKPQRGAEFFREARRCVSH